MTTAEPCRSRFSSLALALRHRQECAASRSPRGTLAVKEADQDGSHRMKGPSRSAMALTISSARPP
jgi:hypothetical protein